jgi:ADP-ribose pyrophosphatase
MAEDTACNYPGIKDCGEISLIKRIFSTYNNRIQVEVETIRVNGKNLEYVRVVQPDFVVVLAILKKRILVEKQYRYGIRKYVYELPAGYIETGERPIETARRELAEETGYYPSKIKLMFETYQAPARISSMMHFYLAEGLIKREKHLDDAEVLEEKFVSESEFESMIKDNSIKDQATIAAYYYYKIHFEK